jgi:hypothetical protein
MAMAHRQFIGVLVVALVAVALQGCARATRPGSPAATKAATPAADLGAITAALRAAGPASGLGPSQSVQTYEPKSLYESIDGEADLFISYECRGLAVAHYTSGKAMVPPPLALAARIAPRNDRGPASSKLLTR